MQQDHDERLDFQLCLQIPPSIVFKKMSFVEVVEISLQFWFQLSKIFTFFLFWVVDAISVVVVIGFVYEYPRK